MPDRVPAAERSENAGVLRYLGQGADAAEVDIRFPSSDIDTWRLGAHPEVVDQLWTRLNAALPTDARLLIAGGAALVHAGSGLVLAVALGTQYALRLSGEGLIAARGAGYQTRHEFRTVGRVLDLEETFGSGWVFGRHDAREPEWLAESYAAANL